uniref:LppM family (lipo)protein n=1 Tax=Dietzia sp. TaxID=1871616 RepID=UPI003FA57476
MASRQAHSIPLQAEWTTVIVIKEETQSTLPAPRPGAARTNSAGPAWLRRGLLLPLILAIAFGLSGCLQLSSEMSVSKNDTVSGRILLAGNNPTQAEDLGGVSVPTGLEEKVRISNYAANNFVGKEVYFTDLTFADVDNMVIGMQPDEANPFTLSFSRSGSKVTFTGNIDLTS